MQGFWVKMEDGKKGYVEGESEYDAKGIAKHLLDSEVKEIATLPYPASPVIWQLDHPVHGKTPNFCYRPQSCKGRTSCPTNPSCTN